jgi:hypothetical protein
MKTETMPEEQENVLEGYKDMLIQLLLEGSICTHEGTDLAIHDFMLDASVPKEAKIKMEDYTKETLERFA